MILNLVLWLLVLLHQCIFSFILWRGRKDKLIQAFFWERLGIIIVFLPSIYSALIAFEMSPSDFLFLAVFRALTLLAFLLATAGVIYRIMQIMATKKPKTSNDN